MVDITFPFQVYSLDTVDSCSEWIFGDACILRYIFPSQEK